MLSAAPRSDPVRDLHCISARRHATEDLGITVRAGWEDVGGRRCMCSSSALLATRHNVLLHDVRRFMTEVFWDVVLAFESHPASCALNVECAGACSFVAENQRRCFLCDLHWQFSSGGQLDASFVRPCKKIQCVLRRGAVREWSALGTQRAVACMHSCGAGHEQPFRVVQSVFLCAGSCGRS